MAARPLPSDLESALKRTMRVERAAATREQWLNAVRATTGLVRAAQAAGWTCADLAPALGMKVKTLRRRVTRVPHDAAGGIEVTPAPPPAGHAAPPLPPEQREWLTSTQARELAGAISPLTLAQWHHAGLLPRTRTDAPGNGYLYSRADIERVLAAPRNGRGVVRSAVLRPR